MEKKIMTVLLGSILILSLLPMSAAETTITQAEDIEISDYDIDDPIFVGEENVKLSVTVENNHGEALENCNLSIEDEPWIEVWEVDRIDDDVTIDENEEYTFEFFLFDVSTGAEPGEYELTAVLEFTIDDDDYEEDIGTIDVNVASIQDLEIDIGDPDPASVYIGELEVDFSLDVTNNEDVELNRANLTIDETGPFEWIVSHDDSDETIGTTPPGDTFTFEAFEFDVSGTADHDIYGLTAILEFTMDDFEGEDRDLPDYEDTFEIEVERNLEVDDAEPRLWPGENFQEMMINIENVGDETVSNIYLTLNDLPEGVSLRDDTARYPGQIASGTEDTVYYRVDVDSDVEPGTHEIEYDLVAVREDQEDVTIEEYGTLDIEVGFAPILEAEIEDDLVVEQGTTELTFDVTFENTGNVDLSEVHVSMIERDPFFIKAVDHYEYGEDVTEPEIPVGDLDIGEEETLEFKIGLHRNLQHGTHRILFDWNGYFFNDGSFDEATQYQYVEVSWGDDAPRTAVLSIDEDEQDDDWIGAEANLEVEMIEIEFSGEIIGDIELAGDITNVEIEVEITNHELVAFRDVEAQLMVGEDTPFFNPANRSKEYVEMHEPAQTLSGEEEDGTAEFTFTVDINTDFVSERIAEGAHAYEATVMITQAVNEDTNEEFSDIEVHATVGLRGYGPNLVVEAELSDHNLEAGENFTLEYTIKNEGDEVARETTVSMEPDLYDNNWEIIDGYIRALASSSERYFFDWEVPEGERSKNTSHLDINLLGVEDGEDIVDLHMYIEGALSSPRPHIWNLYVGEINPGDEYTVSFEMVASEHTQIGQPYQENIHIEWMDADGVMQDEEYPTTISLREAPEEPDEPAEVFGMDAAVFGVILVIIILIIVLAVSLASRKTGVKEEEEETFEEMEEETEIEEEIEEDELFEETEEEPFEEEPPDMDETEEEW